MTIEVRPMSPKAIQYATSAGKPAKTPGGDKYPFDTLTPGSCFTLPLAGANLNSLRVIVCRNNKNDSGKKFKMFIHGERDLIEIARIDNVGKEGSENVTL